MAQLRSPKCTKHRQCWVMAFKPRSLTRLPLNSSSNSFGNKQAISWAVSSATAQRDKFREVIGQWRQTSRTWDIGAMHPSKLSADRCWSFGSSSKSRISLQSARSNASSFGGKSDRSLSVIKHLGPPQFKHKRVSACSSRTGNKCSSFTIPRKEMSRVRSFRGFREILDAVQNSSSTAPCTRKHSRRFSSESGASDCRIEETPMLVTWGQFQRSKEVNEGQRFPSSWQSSSSTRQPPRTKVFRLNLPASWNADFKPLVDRLWQSTKLKNVRLWRQDFNAEPKDSASASRPQPPRYNVCKHGKVPVKDVRRVHPANLRCSRSPRSQGKPFAVPKSYLPKFVGYHFEIISMLSRIIEKRLSQIRVQNTFGRCQCLRKRQQGITIHAFLPWFNPVTSATPNSVRALRKCHHCRKAADNQRGPAFPVE